MQPRPCSVPGCGAPARPYPRGWLCADHGPAEQGRTRYCAPRRCYCGECPPVTGDCGAGVHPAARRVRRTELRRTELRCVECDAYLGLVPRRPADRFTGA